MIRKALYATVAALVVVAPALRADEPPRHLAAAWAEVNLGRDRLGLPRLRWDDRLYRAARASVDWRMASPHDCGADPRCVDHHGLRRRLDDARWPRREGRGQGPPGARVPANFGELEAGIGPVRTPEGHARFWVGYLLSAAGDRAHGDDFRSVWTRGALAVSADGVHFNIAYGYAP